MIQTAIFASLVDKSLVELRFHLLIVLHISITCNILAYRRVESDDGSVQRGVEIGNLRSICLSAVFTYSVRSEQKEIVIQSDRHIRQAMQPSDTAFNCHRVETRKSSLSPLLLLPFMLAQFFGLAVPIIRREMEELRMCSIAEEWINIARFACMLRVIGCGRIALREVEPCWCLSDSPVRLQFRGQICRDASLYCSL